MHLVPDRPRPGERGRRYRGIPADTVPDRYGDGGVVAALEAEIAGLLGKPAALFLPSGSMPKGTFVRVKRAGGIPRGRAGLTRRSQNP